MNQLLPLRVSAVIFGAALGLIFVKESGHIDESLTLSGLLRLFLGAALNVFICLGMALAAGYVLPSLFPKRWRAPAKDVFPFNVWGEPVNFIHYVATTFIAAGATGAALALARWGINGAAVPALFLVVGLGSMAGIKLAPSVFRGRVHEKTYN
jgi:hypothetical protein